MLPVQRTIHERSKNIEIIKSQPTTPKKQIRTEEYGLNLSAFDPSKSSPPNEFMMKLYARMNVYSNYTDKNVDILVKE